MESSSKKALLSILEEHRAFAGAPLLLQGQPNNRLAFLLQGTVRVTRTNTLGQSEFLYEIKAPSMFGLTSFFRPNPPDFNLHASSPVRYLTLDHTAHARLSQENPRAAEQLAVAAVQILADRLDSLDQRITEDLADHPKDHPRVTEWANFRARLFEEGAL